KLLADAGYPNGFETKLLNRAGATFAPRGIFQADQLKQLGIRATVDTKEDTSFYADLFGKTYPIITYGEGETIGDPDVYLYQYLHSKGSKNFSGFANAEIDKLIELQARTLDVQERGKITQDIQRRMLNDYYPIAHILHLVGQMGAWKDVRNYDPPIGLSNNLQYVDTWLAK
ncbi:MAG: ABC transporter substrate-binding protein, partial [Chloroflexota bacterium]